jgi:hypothetical protein
MKEEKPYREKSVFTPSPLAGEGWGEGSGKKQN